MPVREIKKTFFIDKDEKKKPIDITRLADNIIIKINPKAKEWIIYFNDVLDKYDEYIEKGYPVHIKTDGITISLLDYRKEDDGDEKINISIRLPKKKEDSIKKILGDVADVDIIREGKDIIATLWNVSYSSMPMLVNLLINDLR